MPVECEKNRTQPEATFGRIKGAIQVRQEQWAKAAAAPSPAVIFGIQEFKRKPNTPG
jgi:hypothetical protein